MPNDNAVNEQYIKEFSKGYRGDDGRPYSPYTPVDPNVHLYIANTFAHLVPYEHTNWRNETMAWKDRCYLNGNLNPTPTSRIKGPDALKFFADNCVNSCKNWPVGSGKHTIMCKDDGLVMMDGVTTRMAEDEFLTYWMEPYLTYALKKGNYNATSEDLSGKVFLFQLAGPRSLEILEKASGQDFHDVKFMRTQNGSINGKPFYVLRMGMAGTLAYELHGDVENAREIYQALMDAGQEFGIQRLGQRAYMLNHTEDGFPQAYYHFPYPWAEDAGFVEYLGGFTDMMWSDLRGSMGKDLKKRYRSLVELGWHKMSKFDHDFVGRAAIEKEIANPKRYMVTLEWNTDDILDVHRSQFELGDHYTPMDEPNNAPGTGMFVDKVVNDKGEEIGISSGRAYSYNYRKMISLCSIDVAYAELGTEVKIIWGDEGSRQKEIRAIVSRFPYLNENRNQNVDTSTIPRLHK